ncbi:MAG: hypothetical protein JSV62_06015 [Promethearchaeota archaeon]|nr:MAG: hypothetical protein JSV62_06015 [Candidatus Lokiarchaeota archaeon]
MSIRNKIYQHREDSMRVISEYTEVVNHTFAFLRDSKGYLEYKRQQNEIDDKIYNMRLKSLINMTLVYFYSLYEGFTRAYFKKLVMIDFDITEDKFDKQYSNFHDIIEKLMRGTYKIRLPQKTYSTLMKLREARHNIAHGKKNAKSDFAIVGLCFQTLLDYFQYMESYAGLFSRTAKYLKFLE